MNWNMLGDSYDKGHFSFDGFFDSSRGLMSSHIDGGCVWLELLHGL